MCGVNGFTWNDADALRRMHRATTHRGPDDEGFFEAPGISFAHNRLSIIDLSPGGHQPMTSPDGRYTIIYNGEIYNYRELKRELEGLGETFTSQSDTEVLLRFFARWGVDGLRKLNGIFAFAVWDRDERSLTLVRDQIGIKPLYYHVDGTRLIFSSEIKAILEHDVSRVVDMEAVGQYFRLLYVPGPRTMFRDVKKLQPGHALTFSAKGGSASGGKDGQVAMKQWWKLEEGKQITSYKDAVVGVRERVRSAVQRQLVSDRPLGVFLSGGVDSTAVLACLDDIALYMDEPVSNHVQSSTYLLAKFAKPTITVALGGDGGDELFGGYPRYWYAQKIDLIRRIPIARQALGLCLSKEFAKKTATTPGLERHLSFVMQKEVSVRSFLKTPGDVRSALAPSFASEWRDATNQLMAADVQTWLPDESLVRTDKLTMAHGVEERVPLLDVDLVEYAFRIPTRFKLDSRTQGKKGLIDAMRPDLPSHVLDQEKRAWMSPAAKAIRGPLLPFVREVLSPSYNPETAAFIDFAAANKILDDHLSKRAYGLHAIWSILTFQLWWKKFSSKIG